MCNAELLYASLNSAAGERAMNRVRASCGRHRQQHVSEFNNELSFNQHMCAGR